MESEYRKGYVYIQKIFAGTIAETEEGYEFSYNEDYSVRSPNFLLICLISIKFFVSGIIISFPKRQLLEKLLMS